MGADKSLGTETTTPKGPQYPHTPYDTSRSERGDDAFVLRRKTPVDARQEVEHTFRLWGALADRSH